MIKKAHFTLWFILLLNLLLLVISEYKLDTSITFFVKVLIYASGVLLFFLTVKQKGILRGYASLYIFSPIVVFLMWLADGVLGAIVGSVFFAFLAPPDIVVKDNRYQVNAQFSGFLGGCCSYIVYENKYYSFEKKVAEFRSEYIPSEFRKFEVNSRNQAIIHFRGASLDSTLVQLR